MELKVDSSDEFCVVSAGQVEQQRTSPPLTFVNERPRRPVQNVAVSVTSDRHRLPVNNVSVVKPPQLPKAPVSVKAPKPIEIVKTRKSLPPKRSAQAIPAPVESYILSSASAFGGGYAPLPVDLTIVGAGASVVSYCTYQGSIRDIGAGSGEYVNWEASFASPDITQVGSNRFVVTTSGIYSLNISGAFNVVSDNVSLSLQLTQNGGNTLPIETFWSDTSYTTDPLIPISLSNIIQVTAGDVFGFFATNTNVPPSTGLLEVDKATINMVRIGNL